MIHDFHGASLTERALASGVTVSTTRSELDFKFQFYSNKTRHHDTAGDLLDFCIQVRDLSGLCPGFECHLPSTGASLRQAILLHTEKNLASHHSLNIIETSLRELLDSKDILSHFQLNPLPTPELILTALQLPEYEDNPFLLEKNILQHPDQFTLRQKALQEITSWDFLHRFSHRVPTDEVIKAISDFTPLIEIGAARGYWAHLIARKGADIIAFDSKPKRIQWHPVTRGYGNDKARMFPERSLFLCFPDRYGSMASDSAIAYHTSGGKTLLYYGDFRHSGNRIFYQHLNDTWKLTQVIPGYRYEGCNLHIYARKTRAK